MLKIDRTEFKVVDCHTHGGPDYFDWWNKVIKTDEDFIAYLDKSGVDLAIVQSGIKGLKAETKEDLLSANEFVFEFCRKHPKKYFPSVNINPKHRFESETLLKKAKAAGVVWVGELCGYLGGYAYDTEEFKVVMDVIADLDMIAQIHAETNEMAFLLERYHKTVFILPHPGAGKKEIDGRIELAVKHKNLYLDLCGYGADRIGNIEEMVDKLGDERILFGSDFTINDPGVVIARIKNSKISEVSKEKILGLNTLHLLKSKGLNFLI
ncbi:MAG: amidohydrolase family protein [Candidatus Firestonebacteria bacterium]